MAAKAFRLLGIRWLLVNSSKGYASWLGKREAPEVRDCLGYSHTHSPFFTSNRNSHFQRLCCVSRQADYTIRELLIKVIRAHDETLSVAMS